MGLTVIKTKLKNLKFKLKHKLFVINRKWLTNSLYSRAHPQNTPLIHKITAGLSLRNPFYKRLIALMLAFIIIASGTLMLMKPGQAHADWADDSYSYRQVISFTHNADITTPRSITFSLDTAELIAAGAMQADCDDTRFTDINGKFLNYQLTGTCNNAATTYEIVFPSIINGTNIGYVYYGNPQAISASQNVSAVTQLTPSGGDPAITTRTSEEKAPSPALYLKFDDGNGASAQDTSPNNNDAAISGAAWQPKDLCLAERCLYFDGSDDVATVTNADSIDMDRELASGLTYQTWIKVNSDGESDVGQIFNKGTNTYLRTTNQGSDGNVDLEASLALGTTNATVTITDGIPLNKWTHVAMTYSDDGDDEITIYINGVNKGTSTNGSGAPASDANNLLIGGPTTANFNGFIDEFKVYQYERSAAQIKTDVQKAGVLHGVSASFADDQSFMSEGLVGYWKMDDGVNNPCSAGVDKACDSSGNGNTLTWTNGAASTSGKFSYGTNFDGIDDYLACSDANCGGTSKLDGNATATTGWTVSAWFYSSTAGIAQDIVGKSASNGGVGYVLEKDPGNTISLYLDNIGATTTSTITLNTWYHAIGVYDGSKIKIYLNGNLESTTNFNAGVTDTSSEFVIGARNNSGSGHNTFFTGQIDEARIYNRALSPSEVGRLYDWGPGPIGWWKLDENQGTTAYDSSGNGNTGTLTAGPTWTTGKLGSAVNFDGTDDYISTGTISQLAGAQKATIAAWVYRSSPNDVINIGQSFNGIATRQRFVIDINSDGNSYASIENGTLAYGHSVVGSITGWHYLALVYDGSQAAANRAKIYLDGTELPFAVDSGTLAANLATSVNQPPFEIGTAYEDPQTYTKGTIDDVRVYNYALTPKQIVSIMNADHPSVGSPVGSAIAYYKFDEGYGTISRNSGGSCATCSATLSSMDSPATYGSGWTQNGKIGKAINFDGTNDYLDLKYPLRSFISGSEGTVSLWLKPTGNSPSVSNSYLGRGTFGDVQGYMGIIRSTVSGSDRIWVYNWDGTEDRIGIPYNTNEWIHVTWVHRNGTLYAYKNGTLVGSTASGDTQVIDNLTNIGNPYGSNFWSGSIDEVKVYNYGLSDNEVKVDYNQGKAIVLGAASIQSDNRTASSSAASEYCPPGDTNTCTPPIAHWTLDENDGTTANDISGNNYTGTLNNDPQWENGKLGQALNLDGTDDYISTGRALSNFISATDGSMSVWIKPATPGTSCSPFGTECPAIVEDGDGASDGGYMGINIGNISGNDRIWVTNFDGSNDQIGVPYTVGEWTHIVLVHTGGTLYAYKNGSLVNSIASGNTSSLIRNLAIGRNYQSSPKYFNGQIDDVRIYNYARTQAQIAWDYNHGAPLAHWKLDDCTGSTAYDSSGNSYNGTISIGGTGSQTSAGNCATVDTTAAWYNGRNGKYGSSLSFDGTNDYVNAGDIDAAEGIGQITVSAWINTNTLSGGAANLRNIVVKNSSGLNTGWDLDLDTSTGKIDWFINDGTWRGPAQSTPITTNTWYHVVGVYNKSLTASQQLALYVNGVLAGYGTGAGGNIVAGTDNVIIGEWATLDGRAWSGQIDDVRIYNYPLTPAQIRTVYNEGSAVRFGPLTGSP